MLRAAVKVSLKLDELHRRHQRRRSRVLYRTGGFGRRVMQNRIKSGKKSSKSPNAPKSHTKALKRHCEFAVDERDGSVIIGFVAFRSDHAKPLGGRTVPQTIDGGGRERLTVDARTIVKTKIGRNSAGQFTSTVTEKALPASVIEADYQPRPISEPARAPTEQKCLELLRDTPL